MLKDVFWRISNLLIFMLKQDFFVLSTVCNKLISDLFTAKNATMGLHFKNFSLLWRIAWIEHSL